MKLDFLQSCRALAAIAVVIYHAHTWMIPAVLYPNATVWRFFDSGHAGVEIFFVLSGFIMFIRHGHELGQPERIGNFATKRFARIYPTYWIALMLLLTAQLVLGESEKNLASVFSLLPAMALFPTAAPPLLTVAWTLSHEMLFYLLFGVAILSRRLGLALIAVWVAGSAIYTALFTLSVVTGEEYPANFLFSPYALLFAGGMACGWIHAAVTRRQAFALMAAGTAMALIAGYTDVIFAVAERQGGWPILYGTAAMAIIIAGVAFERAGGFTAPRALSFLGDASYSIYLVHSPAMMFGALMALKVGLTSALSPAAMFAALVASGVAAGCVFHLVVERNVMKLFGRGSRPSVASAGGMS